MNCRKQNRKVRSKAKKYHNEVKASRCLINKIHSYLTIIASTDDLINKFFGHLCIMYGVDNVTLDGTTVYVYFDLEAKTGVRFTQSKDKTKYIIGLINNNECHHISSLGYTDVKEVAEQELLAEITSLHETKGLFDMPGEACSSDECGCMDEDDSSCDNNDDTDTSLNIGSNNANLA